MKSSDQIAEYLQQTLTHAEKCVKVDGYPFAYGYLARTVEHAIGDIRNLDPAAALEAEAQ